MNEDKQMMMFFWVSFIALGIIGDVFGITSGFIIAVASTILGGLCYLTYPSDVKKEVIGNEESN